MTTLLDAPRERPLLMCGEMVRATLQDRKSQTRRCVNPQPFHRLVKSTNGLWYDADCINPGAEIKCPFFVGQILWVKETFCSPGLDSAGLPILCYRASGDPVTNGTPWKPSIFMPRWASRITLEVVDVRGERVQDITAEDCIAEGIDYSKHKCGCEACATSTKICPATTGTLIEEYQTLWDALNGKRKPGKPDLSWAANPWVFVLVFKRIKP